MRYGSAGAFRRALEQRLLTRAQQDGLSVVRLRKLVVFDRLMARLMVVASDRWILKGAVALLFRVGPGFRATKDLDLGRQDDEPSATADFRAVQSVDLGDYFTFAVERTTKSGETQAGRAVRYHVRAAVDGRPFEDVTVDVGFGEPSVLAPEVLGAPDLLSFAGIPPVQVPTLAIEQHIAEKLHAYTWVYAGGRMSSRVKDLVDLAAIASLFPFQAGRLRRALEATFRVHEGQRLPATLPPPPPAWSTTYRRLASEMAIDPNFRVGWQLAARLLDPILSGAVDNDQRWDPTRSHWQ